MSQDFIKLKTVIKPELLKKELKYAGFVGGLGIFILILASIFIPAHTLKFLGPIIFIVWVVLSIAAFRPYNKLKRIIRYPDTLIIQKHHLIYKSFLIPFDKLKMIHYIEKANDYGIQLDFWSGESLFLPYFTKASFEVLKEILASKGS